MEEHATLNGPFDSSAKDADTREPKSAAAATSHLVSSSSVAAHIPGAILNNSLYCELQALKLCSGKMEAVLDAIFYL